MRVNQKKGREVTKENGRKHLEQAIELLLHMNVDDVTDISQFPLWGVEVLVKLDMIEVLCPSEKEVYLAVLKSRYAH